MYGLEMFSIETPLTGEYAKIPIHLIGDIQRWVDCGILPSSDFLRAVLGNDLKRSIEHADEHNLRILPVYVRFLYNKCPQACWGGPDSIQNWQKMGGLRGIADASGEQHV